MSKKANNNNAAARIDSLLAAASSTPLPALQKGLEEIARREAEAHSAKVVKQYTALDATLQAAVRQLREARKAASDIQRQVQVADAALTQFKQDGDAERAVRAMQDAGLYVSSSVLA